MTAPVIRFDRVRVCGEGNFTILDEVSFDIPPGQRVGIIGCSGSGKTTLARTIFGLSKLTSGTVTVLGQAVKRPLRQPRAQLLLQDPMSMLHPQMRLGQMLGESISAHRAQTTVEQSLHRVGLPGRELAYPDQLSGGEKRRFCLARALVASPRLLVTDELTAGLDADLKHEMMALILKTCPEDCTIVMVTHDLEFIFEHCDRFLILEAGQLVDDVRKHDLENASLSAPGLALFKASGLLK